MTDGEGAVQTLTTAGFRETPLRPGGVVWFEPGTVHRLVNGGGLTIVVLMQNSGLPEAGDAVLTFPPEVLADPAAYASAAALPDGERRGRRQRGVRPQGSGGDRLPGVAGRRADGGCRVPRRRGRAAPAAAEPVAAAVGGRRGSCRSRHRPAARRPGAG
ncbi:hypothetical protein NKG94_11725 [Micromonospora sp. M12]